MDIYEHCRVVARNLGFTFTLRRRPLTEDEVFSETGMLPGIVKRANDCCILCFGYSTGLRLVPEERSMLGNRIEVDPKAPLLIALHFVTDVLVEIAARNGVNGAVELEELLMD